MADNLSPQNRRKTMQAVKNKKTSIERRLWAILAGSGIKGWRKNAKDIFGCPDVVFEEKGIAIFVDGCFWHGCPKCNKVLPVNNHNYWLQKIQKNKRRSIQVNRFLSSREWFVVHVWEHEFKKSERNSLREKIKKIVR